MRTLVSMQMEGFKLFSRAGIAGAAVAAMLAGCSSTPRTPAPIVESSASSAPPVVQTTSPAVIPAPVVPLNAPPAEPGFYRVKPGDTLYGIARNYKQKPDDLAKWNTLPESKQVNIGQLLRVAPPGAAVASASTAQKKDMPPLIATPQKSSSDKTEKSVAQKPAPEASEEHVSAARGTFVWPAKGEVVRKFGASGNKGIDISGKVGQPVKAAAGGKVVYAGSGLRSYGRMIIVRHGNDFLTAYAYNDKLLVHEGDTVKQGATIADMGTGPSGSPELHFEVRKSGAAVDPLPLLGAGG
ncbi:MULTISPECIES: peptidoglycan DD-metalloendopeptidase family protein [unclassified Caballeronia]|uniref:peptidoglycan DD-metalloendopeptidase family protein n=1 Tax=unclassified Caballeronia TaxID=2646786 RepID=UPI0020284CCD|nr:MULTISPECIES: peptidoglycan DD-metalloendopeptidase family protein [unclassified Caballeronia]